MSILSDIGSDLNQRAFASIFSSLRSWLTVLFIFSLRSEKDAEISFVQSITSLLLFSQICHSRFIDQTEYRVIPLSVRATAVKLLAIFPVIRRLPEVCALSGYCKFRTAIRIITAFAFSDIPYPHPRSCVTLPELNFLHGSFS
jgi:hypothetical protein